MNYRKTLEQAVMYIENYLGDDIRAEEVAKVTGYSYYHLNRQFTSVLGENVRCYIKKRRLADAAKKLLYTDHKIADIAMENGFESQDVFSRAFKSVYQVSPLAYRRNRLDIFIGAKEQLDTGLLDHLARNVTVHPQIVELPEIKVAGLRGETSLRNNKLRELWEQANITEIPNRFPRGRFFCIREACRDNTLYHMNDDVLVSEVAGTEVSSFDGLPEVFVRKVIPGGRYAVFTHRGSLRALPLTYNYIWGIWFLTTKEEMDLREDFELCDERFLGYDHPDSEMDVYIPVR